MRKPIGKTLRFKILSKYQFTCIYCGNTPPSVLLEVDHIIPVSKGGKNNEENLVCSCFDCNRGKSDKTIESSPSQIIDNLQLEKIKQYQEYIKYIKLKDKVINQSIEMVCEIYSQFNVGYEPNDKYRLNIRDFIEKIGLDQTMDAMRICCMRAEGSMKYFCGICWNKYNSLINKNC